MRRKPVVVDFVSIVSALEKAVEKAVDERLLSAFDLSNSEVRLLLSVCKCESASVTTLARLGTLDRSQASRLLNVLEERGLIERARSVVDARDCCVKPTEQGRRTCCDAAEFLRHENLRLLSVLSDVERSVLNSAIAKMIAQVRPDRSA